MNLLAFPCDPELVPSFFEKLDGGKYAAVILKKQEASLAPKLSRYGVTQIYPLSEALYGQITCQETRAQLADIRAKGFERAFFPINDFCGNVALFLEPLVEQVIAVNATSYDEVQLSLPKRKMHWTTSVNLDAEKVRAIQHAMCERLRQASSLGAALGENGEGERPTSGLLFNAPYECEILSRYMVASQKVTGRVLEIGCGLGLGAYMMAKMNPAIEIVALDYDAGVIRLAQQLWGDEPRLQFHAVNIERGGFEKGPFDAVVCFEVIEHVAEPDRLMNETCRFLKKGGLLLGSTPNSSLYPYRVNKGLSGEPSELRRQGVWPWHIQEFDEAKIARLLKTFEFADVTVSYPTFIAGLDVHNAMLSQSFEEQMRTLSKVRWSTADFGALDSFYPCFSGFSFMFAGRSSASA